MLSHSLSPAGQGSDDDNGDMGDSFADDEMDDSRPAQSPQLTTENPVPITMRERRHRQVRQRMADATA